MVLLVGRGAGTCYQRLSPCRQCNLYAEVSVRYSGIEDLEAAPPEGMIERETIPLEAGLLAGKAYLAYRRRGGTKRSSLPDFFIGAHAAVAGHRLLTRDAARVESKLSWPV